MRSLAQIDEALEGFKPLDEAIAGARLLVGLAEDVLAHWAIGRHEAPTTDEREGFRLLALHRQGAHGEPSFNACRETCREIAYHYNLLSLQANVAESAQRQRMMAMLVHHVALFVIGKMQQEQLGEFCCASKPLRLESA
ncbi:MAG: hypothetical protein ACKVQU_15165 [Burkholderiales bacterium]